jgi:hypothetical protein
LSGGWIIDMSAKIASRRGARKVYRRRFIDG